MALSLIDIRIVICWCAQRTTAHWRTVDACLGPSTPCRWRAARSWTCPAKVGRKARTAKIVVRFMKTSLVRPRHVIDDNLPPSVPMTVVDVREVDAPAGAPTPVHWRLLTTRAVADAAEALAIADLYRRRWAIEQLFRTMKTKGFDIEGRLSRKKPLHPTGHGHPHCRHYRPTTRPRQGRGPGAKPTLPDDRRLRA